jgi:hypothetical protein
MKNPFFVLALVILAITCWLVLRSSKDTLQPVAPISSPAATTNAPTEYIVPNNSVVAIITNSFVRPDSIDEDHWSRLMALREMLLAENQPVEFYARVVDQDSVPVAGATLNLTLSRVDETLFTTTNFFHLNMGDEILHKSISLVSDIGGWFKLKNVTGKALWIESLNKDGYVTGNYSGGVAYEPQGVRTPISDALMTNSWNPQTGYVLRLQKIEK